jgi:hypothetical protein
MEKAIQYDSNRKSLIQITSDVTEAATHPVTSAADFLYLFYTPSPSILQQQIPSAQSIIWLDSSKIGKAESLKCFLDAGWPQPAFRD